MKVLRTAVGRYPHTRPLKDGAIRSELLQFDFADVSPANRAFAPMVRELRYDVSEMAIATFLQAKACGKALVLLPVVLAARFQQSALLCRTDAAISGPADLAGKRLGLRAYSQTTAMWLRGIFSEEYGLRSSDIRWITFEGAHTAEIHDPPFAARAAPGQDMLPMLRDGALDAVIVGTDLPDDPGLRTVFADPDASGKAFFARHGFVPVNHLLAVTRTLADEQPELVTELVRMFRSAATEAGRADLIAGRDGLRPAMACALAYAIEQDMLPKALTLSDVWDGLPASVS